MKLVDMKVQEYLDVLKSSSPAPGGGSVSALSGAQGVALVMMVCDLTIGKEKLAKYEENCKAVKEKAEGIYKELCESIDRDTEAFNIVANAFKMPKGTDEEKKLRSEEIQRGTLEATKVPFNTLKLCYEGMKIAKEIVGRSNPNAASDIGVAALNLKSAAQGAWLNVKINLGSLKDEVVRNDIEASSLQALSECEKLGDDIYEEVNQTI